MGEGGALGEGSWQETSDLIRAVLQQSTDNLRYKRKLVRKGSQASARRLCQEGFVKVPYMLRKNTFSLVTHSLLFVRWQVSEFKVSCYSPVTEAGAMTGMNTV